MRFLGHSGRYALTSCVAAASLAGCGGSQPPIGAMPQSRVVAHTERAGSWMLPERLYISSTSGDVYVYSYPQSQYITTLKTPNGNAGGECTDPQGDLFVTTLNSSGDSTIYEYAPGGSDPIAALSDPGEANGCAVDPATGNLAGTNPRDANNPYYSYAGDVALYTNAQGSATMYYPTTSGIGGFVFCGYDGNSNLYLSAEVAYGSGVGLVRLSRGSHTFETISIGTKLHGASSVQSDGKHMTVSSISGEHQPLLIYRLRISGSAATIIGTTQLTTKKNSYAGQTLIQNDTVIGANHSKRANEQVSFWKYPNGGSPRRNIKNIGRELWGVAVSAAAKLP